MPADRGLTGYIIRTRKSLLIKENVAAWQDKMGVPRVGESAQSWLGVPLMIGEQILGVMAIQSYTGERLYDEHDQDLLTAIASQAAIAIQNARLFEQTQQQANEATAFNEIIQAISLHVDLPHVLETTYQHIHKLVPVDVFIVALRDEQADTLHYPLVYDEGQRYEQSVGQLRPETPTGQVIMTGQPLLINRTPEELAHAAQTMPIAAMGNAGKPSASLMYLPLKLGQAVIGALSVQSYQVKAYTPEHLTLMTRLVNQLAVAIQNARLFDQTQEALTEMDSLYRASAEINTAQSYGDILSALCKHTHLADGAHNIALNHFDHIWTPQQMPHDIHVLTQLGNQLPVLQTAVARYPLVAGIERVLQADALTVVEDVATDPRVSDKLRTFYQNTLGASSIIFLPLVVSGKWIGYIHALYQQPKPLSEAEMRRLTLLTSQAAVAVQNLRSVEETQLALAETERLYTASRQLASAKDLPEIVSAVADMQTPDINRAVLWLFDRDDRDAVTSAIVSAGWHSGSGVPPMPIGTRLPLALLQAMRLVLTTEPVFSNDVQHDARIDGNTAALLQQQNIGAIAILPLWAGTRQIGAFLLESETPHEFVESEIRPYISLTQQMSIAVDNRLLFERTQHDAQRERTIAAISERIYSTTDVKDLLRITAEELRRATGSARAVVKLGHAGPRPNGSTIQPVPDDEGVTQ
jgi:GAF domain-containing protein